MIKLNINDTKIEIPDKCKDCPDLEALGKILKEENE